MDGEPITVDGSAGVVVKGVGDVGQKGSVVYIGASDSGFVQVQGETDVHTDCSTR